MTEYAMGLGLALWFGVLTSISPCPLATNIVAMSFVARRASRLSLVLSSGAAYCIGRMVAYIVLGLVVVGGFLSVPSVSFFLQKYLNLFLGPLLILIGMFLLGMLEVPFNGFSFIGRIQKRLEGGGLLQSFLLGSLFALSFCPVSAALFFGSLIPLAIKLGSPVMPTILFGLGTALPVIVVTAFLSSGAKSMASLFNKLSILDKWSRTTTGVLIIMIGIYLCFTHIFLAG
jgi:cytochrome c biogenesis protein CcdA